MDSCSFHYKKGKRYKVKLGSKLTQQPFPRQRRQKACWYILDAHKLIRKRTDTAIAFTENILEYRTQENVCEFN